MSIVPSTAPLVHTHWRRPARKKRAVPGLLLAVWGALILNTYSFSAQSIAVPIPTAVGKLITQGSLVLALLLVLALNPRGLIRPNLVLLLLTILGVLAFMVSIHNQFAVGSTYRALRLIVFIIVLWLLTPWWGRTDMLILRCHRRVLWLLLGTVGLGAAVAPGLAFSFGGRLAGVLWPIPATQVAHLAAVLFGTSVVLWMCRIIPGRNAAVTVVISGAALGATHTRTAIAGTLIGLAVATTSLFLGHVRARRLSAFWMVATVVAASFFATGMTTWAMRGQTTREASQLTGRTEVWSDILAADRPRVEDLFGSGLSNQGFNGLPIDSAWLGVFVDQGVVGVVILATMLLVLLIMAATHERGPQRAVALFLVVYCMVASFTETGLGAATMYSLDLVVAAALLAPSTSRTAMDVKAELRGPLGDAGSRAHNFGRSAFGRRSGVEARSER